MAFTMDRAGAIASHESSGSSTLACLALTGLTVLVVTCHCRNVEAAEFRSDTTVLSDDIVYDVNADGTSTTDRTESVRIDTDKGVKEQGRFLCATAIRSRTWT
jgi:hypothetical protein